MVIVESMTSARVLGHEPEIRQLEGLGRAMPYVIGLYLAARLTDIIVRGIVWETVAPSLQSLWWWLEIGLLLAAMLGFMATDIRSQRRGLLLASVATIGALIVHRTGVAMIGLSVPEYGAYIPAWSEIAITVGIVSMGLIVFRLAAEFLPIYAAKPQSELGSARQPREFPQISTSRPAAAAR
jgi:Ni/Fe-hydrogenase subunit HybB-like protein